MSTQQLQQARLPVSRMNVRRWWWLGIGLLLVVTALLVYNANRTPAPTGNNATSVAQSDPAASIARSESLGDYLRAQSTIQTDAPTDPAASIARSKSLGDYLRAQSIIQTDAPTDPAVQSVMDYLRAHGR